MSIHQWLFKMDWVVIYHNPTTWGHHGMMQQLGKLDWLVVDSMGFWISTSFWGILIVGRFCIFSAYIIIDLWVQMILHSVVLTFETHTIYVQVFIMSLTEVGSETNCFNVKYWSICNGLTVSTSVSKFLSADTVIQCKNMIYSK